MSEQRDNNDGRRTSDQALILLREHIATDERIQAEMLAQSAMIERIQAEMLVTLNAINVSQLSMLDMLKIFNSIKGFWFICKWITILSLGIVSLSGAVMAILYAAKAWVKS